MGNLPSQRDKVWFNIIGSETIVLQSRPDTRHLGIVEADFGLAIGFFTDKRRKVDGQDIANNIENGELCRTALSGLNLHHPTARAADTIGKDHLRQTTPSAPVGNASAKFSIFHECVLQDVNAQAHGFILIIQHDRGDTACATTPGRTAVTSTNGSSQRPSVAGATRANQPKAQPTKKVLPLMPIPVDQVIRGRWTGSRAAPRRVAYLYSPTHTLRK